LIADEADAQLYLARLRFKTPDLDGARAAFDRATELHVTELSPRLERTYNELRQQLSGAPGSAEPAGPRSVAVPGTPDSQRLGG